jgi:hypothetical protein
MTSGFMAWSAAKHKSFEDPRVAISKHIGWMKPHSPDTEFHTPEPDNFNYALFGSMPLECIAIEDSVIYKDAKLGGWWSVYYVPTDKVTEFLLWAERQTVDIYWHHTRSPKKRPKRTLLWTKKAQPEMTFNERLYTSGYYKQLQTTFNIDMESTLGEPRPNMPLNTSA